MGRARDSQRSAFWAAQAVLETHARLIETQKRMLRFVENARSRAYLKRRYKTALRREIILDFCVWDTRENFEPFYSTITVPPKKDKWTDLTMCRQIAYVLLMRTHGQAAWHGREFCAIYLDVVRAMMGAAAYELLKGSFRKHKVRFTPKRVLSPEQRAAARERLAKAREKINTG